MGPGTTRGRVSCQGFLFIVDSAPCAGWTNQFASLPPIVAAAVEVHCYVLELCWYTDTELQKIPVTYDCCLCRPWPSTSRVTQPLASK